MDCEKSRELIIELLYDELPAESITRLQKHLVGCEDCSKYKEEIQQTLECLDQADDIHIPVDLADLHNAIDKKRRRFGDLFRFRWPVWASAIGICGILLFVFTMFASEIRYEDNALTIRFRGQKTDSLSEKTAEILSDYQKDQLAFQEKLSDELKTSVIALTKMINDYETQRDEQFAGAFQQVQMQQNQMLRAVQRELEILTLQTEDEFKRSYVTMAAMVELANNP